MTQVSQVLSGLTSLYAETKRKNSVVRLAIESAQHEASKLSLSIPISTLEQTTVNTLCAPFIVGLDPKNPKMLASAMNSLQMLAASCSLSEKAFADALATLHTAVPSLAVDMQLKTLQILPILVINYDLQRHDFSMVLSVAAYLVNSSNAMVSNTAAATLHQILSSLFEKLDKQKEISPNGSDHVTEEMWMCCHVATDLCCILSSDPMVYFSKEVRFSSDFALEMLENILHVNGRLFVVPDLMRVLKEKLFPALLALVHTTTHFSTFVRCSKLFYSLAGFSALADETLAFLSYTNGLALADSTPLWQSVVVVELYGLILSDFTRVKILYEKGASNIDDIFSVFVRILNSHSFSLNGHSLFSDKITVPVENGPMLSKNSSLKVQVIDHLDKTEPPGSLPDLYMANLVLNGVLTFAHGVSKFVTALSSDSVDPETLEAEVEFITSLNESVFPQVMGLFQKFIYSAMTLDYFHMTIRYLQRYTHAIGLLGLSKQRDEVLSLLAHCIMTSAQEEVVPVPTQNTNLLALGGSIVESLSSTMQGTVSEKGEKKTSQDPEYKARTFNSRQVLCLRAMIKLATSLGSTLHSSWHVILVSFQWAEYSINGPESGSSGRREMSKFNVEPILGSSDMEGVETSKLRFFENVSQYQESSLTELVQALIDVYEDKEAKETETCPYNKSYFLNMLTKIAKLDYVNFPFYDSKVRDLISDFFCRISTDRASAYETRAYIVECFTDIIVQVTKREFREQSAGTAELAAQKSVSAFNNFLERLLALGTPKEYLVLNCETEMHLTILSTLHGLIDEYDKYYQNSWEMVFRILNTAFVKNSTENKNLVEKIQSLISTSFDTLKLILDEFTTSLPFNQLKSLIDSLMNFCSQTYDLNISFSAVSYFWLISDCINNGGRNGRESMESRSGMEIEEISDMSQLKVFISGSSTGTSVSYQALTIYLLAQLSTLSTDFRDQVREGAIQTLFQIIDVRGKQLSSWNLIYDIVFPALLNVSEPQGSISRKSLVDSYNLTLSGLVSMYSKYMTNFQENPEITQKFWTRMVSYLTQILQLHWNELDFTAFQSLRDVLMSLKQVEHVPHSIVELLFDFWASVSINYDFVQPEYQESLAIYNQTFQILYSLMGELSMDQAVRAMVIMNKCVKYPVLKPAMSDETRPSNLQKAVFENLQRVLETSENRNICALVMQQLAEISVFPYGIKSRIEKKLQSKFEGKLKIPSFIAVSQLSINLISVSLHRLPEMADLLGPQFQLGKIIRSLLEAVYNQEPETEPNADALWVKSNDIIAQLVLRLMDKDLQALEDNRRVWQLLMECLLANFSGNNGDYDVKQYEKLAGRILPQFFYCGHHDLIREFVSQVYLHSYVYETNQVEKELMGEKNDGETLSSYYRLSGFEFEESFGSTEKCKVKENREMRLKCLTQLLEFPKEDGFSSQVTKEMLLTRVAFSLRRFVADERLIGNKPLPQIQEQELVIILNGFLGIAREMDQAKLQGIMGLLSRGVEYSERIAGIDEPMKALLALSQ